MTWNISSSHIILILLILIRLNTRAGLVFAIDNIRFNDVDGINLNGGIVEDTSTRKLLNNKLFKSNYKLSSERADDNLAFINSSCDNMMSSDLTVVKKDGKSKRNEPSRTGIARSINLRKRDHYYVSSSCSKPPCQLISCNSTAPFCIVDENGFRCDSTNQNSWRINNDNGLTFSDLEFEGGVCQIFIPPNNPDEATLLIELMVNSSFGTLYLPDITGTWERPFDFLGNCKQPFFCDTSINGGITSSKAVTNGTCRLKFSRATPCFSVNQCDTHRCTGDFQQSDKGSLVANETVVAPNGQPILSNEICAALGDLQRPLISQPLDTPTDTATSTPEIILLSVVGTGTNSDDSLRNISLSARKGVLNLFSTNKNENFSTTSRQVDFKGSEPNSSEAAIALISPVPAIKRSSLFSNSNELYNNESEIDLISNYSSRTSLDSSNTRGSNVGSIGIINMTNVGIGRSNENLSVQNPLEIFKLARVPSQTARIFNPDSYLQLQQNQNMFTLPENNIKEQFTEASEKDKNIKEQFTEGSEKDKKIKTQLAKIEDEITRENALNATLELEDMVIVKDPNEEILEEKVRQERRQKKLEMLYNQQFKGSSNV
ncbi:12212_t:CDS:2 [Cetraspora pellucida]|uniref:12212_t:CDS:1 n=1 Tax=Cetraspora pellucida TaxID=1433469 RepID=A0ACA9LSI1_9GLOM|nr:12212_t:CDS:2 [Cetraspora pellucida]